MAVKIYWSLPVKRLCYFFLKDCTVMTVTSLWPSPMGVPLILFRLQAMCGIFRAFSMENPLFSSVRIWCPGGRLMVRYIIYTLAIIFSWIIGLSMFIFFPFSQIYDLGQKMTWQSISLILQIKVGKSCLEMDSRALSSPATRKHELCRNLMANKDVLPSKLQ